MAPPKFGGPSQFARRNRSTNRSMEGMIEVVDVEDIPTIESESFSLTRVEEQNPEEESVEVIQVVEVQNPRVETNPNVANPEVALTQGEKEEDSESIELDKLDDEKKPRIKEASEVEDDSDADEEMKYEATQVEAIAGPSKKSAIVKKACTQQQVELSVPHILDSFRVSKHMLGSFPKLRYVDHDVIEVSKFLELVQEVYMKTKSQLRKESW